VKKYIKLSKYAKDHSITYGTALRHYHKGILKGYQDETTKTIYIEEETKNIVNTNRVVLYSRVSSSENRKNAEKQLERLRMYSLAKGYTIVEEIIEVASSLNDKRPKLEKILKKDNYDILLVEQKDRLTRFGFNYIEVLLEKSQQRVEVINYIQEEKEDLINDLVSIITSFCARIYGQRRTKRKTEDLIKELKKEQLNGSSSFEDTN
jgi:resolvase domain protein